MPFRAGEKLLRIRDGRLYREEFANFEEFARTVLGHSRHYANRLITGYVLIQEMIAQAITVLPDNERITRELAKYPKKDRKEIWKRAVQILNRRKPSYKTIREAALEIVPSKKTQKIWTSQLLEKLRIGKARIDHIYRSDRRVARVNEDDRRPIA